MRGSCVPSGMSSPAESLSQVAEKRPTAAGECRRDRRANAVRTYLIKYGTPQPVRLHNPPIKDVRRVGMINGIGNQLEVRDCTVEVPGPGSQSMIIAGHAAAGRSFGVPWSAVAVVVGGNA